MIIFCKDIRTLCATSDRFIYSVLPEMATLPWNPLKKVTGALNSKPLLTEGLVSAEDDRAMEITYVKLQEMEENSKKIHKEVKKYEECLSALQRADDRLASDLRNSGLCEEPGELRVVGEELGNLSYQMMHNTEDLVQLAHKTVREPIKKLNNEYPQIQSAIKKRDLSLQEAQRSQVKFEKLGKLEKTGSNAVKKEQAKRSYMMSRDEFEKTNKMLLLELPQFYERRVDYFQPSLQALVRAQMDYYGENTRLHNKLSKKCEENCDDSQDLDKLFSEIRALSIVGN